MPRFDMMHKDHERARERPAYTILAEAAVEPDLSEEDWRDLHRGAALFSQGAYWESHEAWEQVWRRCDAPSRIFFQGLIQLAAAYHQLERGVYHGVVKHFNNASAKLGQFPDRFLGVDVGSVCRCIDDGRVRVKQLGASALGEFERHRIPTITFGNE
jgi:hypothetical protein